ncbi:hypothetical protein BJY21_004141 [Kineosphaera limosa]|nr:hypothetical protein [Kineosphaera limosa]
MTCTLAFSAIPGPSSDVSSGQSSMTNLDTLDAPSNGRRSVRPRIPVRASDCNSDNPSRRAPTPGHVIAARSRLSSAVPLKRRGRPEIRDNRRFRNLGSPRRERSCFSWGASMSRLSIGWPLVRRTLTYPGHASSSSTGHISSETTCPRTRAGHKFRLLKRWNSAKARMSRMLKSVTVRLSMRSAHGSRKSRSVSGGSESSTCTADGLRSIARRCLGVGCRVRRTTRSPTNFALNPHI